MHGVSFPKHHVICVIYGSRYHPIVPIITGSFKTGKEINALLDKYTDAIDAQNVAAKYLKEYLKVLPAEKVAKLFLGEEKFRQSQINRLRQPMGGQPMSQPGGFGNGNRRQQQKSDKN